jgi:clan AA aspartic protease
MGLLTVDIEIVSADEATSESHLALVDTGASYLSLPRQLLERLGYESLDTQTVVFANGETAVWHVTEVRARLGRRERTVIAFMAEPGAPALIGAQTLETFGLGVDPLRLRLIPVDAYLAGASA